MWRYNSNELYHHGILGMKWGVRRYQNSDGSLTPAGKVRYGDENKVSGRASTKLSKNKTSSNNNYGVSNKSIKEMSDDELNQMISRLQKEKQLKALLNDEPMSSIKDQNVQKKGQDYVSKALKEGGSQALSAMTKTIVLYVGGKVISSMLNNPELGKSISGISYSNNSTKKSDSASDASSKKSTTSSESAKKSSEPKKSNASKDSKDDPIDAKFREVFDVKFKDIKGSGSSKYKPDADTIIDVDYREVSNVGKEFINNYGNQLLLPYNDKD